jgi:hypothetical protein
MQKKKKCILKGMQLAGHILTRPVQKSLTGSRQAALQISLSKYHYLTLQIRKNIIILKLIIDLLALTNLLN